MKILKAANDNVGPDDLLRLAQACTMAFPNGGMTVNGLRTESKRGNLVVVRIANKDFTTLAYIKDMEERCRVKPEGHICIGEESDEKAKSSLRAVCGSSSMAHSMLPQVALLAKIRKRKSA